MVLIGDHQSKDRPALEPGAIRLALFIGSLDKGGAERQFLQLARTLADRGHYVILVALFPGGRYWAEAEMALGDRLISLYGKRPRRRLGRLASIALANIRLRRVMALHSVNVLYSALEVSSLVAWLATRGKGRPQLAWGIRDSNPLAYGDWRRHGPLRLMALLSRSVPLVLANSRAGKEDYLRIGFRPRQFKVVPNGIDTLKFRKDRIGGVALREEWGLPFGSLVVGAVGRASDVKGYDLFLGSAKLLADRSSQMNFVVVGVREKTDEFKAAFASLGLADRAIVCPEFDEMASVYSALDVLCSTSISEGFSNVIAEAMACECPCVVTDVGDSARIVGDSGAAVSGRDPKLFADEVLRILSRRDDLGRRARQRVVSEYSVESSVRLTESALADIAAPRR